jgi:alkanesulfonate monooxygenase SsuD/methylene tetrahydromethanopterin reductase-like flavin-dependent oxidoreductase (luciferase family)
MRGCPRCLPVASGQPFGYEGKHYSVRPTDHMVPDPPAQRPRPPVWVVGARMTGQPGQRSLARAARWDGLLPVIIKNRTDRAMAGPSELSDLIAEVMALRVAAGLAVEPYDVIIEGDSSREFIQLDPPDPADAAPRHGRV